MELDAGEVDLPKVVAQTLVLVRERAERRGIALGSAIDPAVAKTWEKYDIRLVLEQNWGALENRLRGKLHVFMGDADTFYLEGAVVRLAESLRELGSDAEITILPGKDHGGVLSAELLSRGRQQMSEVYRRGEAAQ